MNDVKLQEGHPVDENLRPLKVGGKSTALETAQHGNGAKVNGDLEVTGEFNIKNKGNINLDSGSDYITLRGTAGTGLEFNQHHIGTWDIENLSEDKDILIKVNDGGSSTEVLRINGAEPYVSFPICSAGFARKEAIFSVTALGSLGTDDTDIDFRLGNKFRLEMTGDITNINLVFPTVSGNFLLVCTTNGDHDVTNWNVFESDESAATTSNVMWAGGSVPAFTNNGIDIVSFYWDASEQQAYGVASLAFATP